MRAILLLCALLIANDAYALRCGREVVQVGMYTWDVLERCGDPDFVDSHIAIRGTRLRGPLELSQYEEVEIEEWVYNFGPRKFKQLLEFENNVLVRILKLDYGY